MTKTFFNGGLDLGDLQLQIATSCVVRFVLDGYSDALT
jgi:hypothetical protein